MDNVIAPKVDGLKPLPVRTPTAAPAPAAAAPAAPVAPAPATDQKQVNVGKVGLDAPSRTTGLPQGVPEVDFAAVEPADKPAPAAAVHEVSAAQAGAPSFYSRAAGMLGNALSITARAVVSPMTLAADQTFLEKVKSWFSSDGNQTLGNLSEAGKLSAIDKNLTTLKGVIGQMIKAGADPAVVEALNVQVDNPQSIDQIEGKLTCQAAVFQKQLAEANPGAYAKAAHELYTTGSTTLPDGTKITISPENLEWLKKQNLPVAEMINAVFQVALVEAVESPATYDVATDTVTEPKSWWQSMLGGLFGGNREKGVDFANIQKFFEKTGSPLFDPRALAEGSAADKAAALKAALEAAQKSGRGLAVPVHSDVGAQEKFHLVAVTQVDADGNVTVHDPETGKETVYSQEEFLKVVGWDITGSDNVGGGRVSASGGGGSGTV